MTEAIKLGITPQNVQESSVSPNPQESCVSPTPQEYSDAPLGNNVREFVSEKNLSQESLDLELGIHLNCSLDLKLFGKCFYFISKLDGLQKWNKNAILLLISLYKEFEDELDNSRKKKNVWIKISLRMKEKGYVFTNDECDNKFRNLKARYTIIMNLLPFSVLL